MTQIVWMLVAFAAYLLLMVGVGADDCGGESLHESALGRDAAGI